MTAPRDDDLPAGVRPAGGGPLLPPDGSHPHALVADVANPVLDDAGVHHLARVRRLRTGDPLTVTDGAGVWRWCRFRTDGHLEVAGDVHEVDRPSPSVTVAFALTKGVKPDWTVQKLTEVGVDRIIPFRAARSVVRWDDDKAAAQHRRMVDIVVAAVQQSRRCWAPVVDEVASVADLVTLRALRADRAGPALLTADRAVAVGPEGGWTAEECEVLTDRVGFGHHTLRSETAAMTAGVLLASLRSG